MVNMYEIMRILESVVREMSDSHRCSVNGAEAKANGADDYEPSQHKRLK